MIYSSADIIEAYGKGNIYISEFDPIVESGRPLQPNSYDLRLGNFFYDVVWTQEGPWFIGPLEFNNGDKVDIPVGGTRLAMTKERTAMRGKVCAFLQDKSSIPRVGVATCYNAGVGDIGYGDFGYQTGTYWTLELSAHVVLGKPWVIVGDPICQIVFFETKTEPVMPYQGQYNVDNWPENMVPLKWRHHIVSQLIDIPRISEVR